MEWHSLKRRERYLKLKPRRRSFHEARTVIALRPLASPAPAYAQAKASHELYIEPGTTLLRAPDGSQQVMGKVVIDVSTGKVWGFPTLTEKPYPVDTVHPVPPVSHPFYLGQLDFSAIRE